MDDAYSNRAYFSIALDPIHVGTGGYRLGRVDNTIVREPATNIPKIPGTSMAGVARAYTAMQKGKYRWKENDKEYCCAGKGGEQGENHCGKSDCPVCVTYGFSKGETGISFQGLAQFSDARILFFPVTTMVGPMWVTSPMRLEAAEIFFDGIEPGNWLELNSKLSSEGGEYFFTTSSAVKNSNLNLGWLYLSSINTEAKIGTKAIAVPKEWKTKNESDFYCLTDCGINPAILNRIIIISDRLFSHVVNDNLEIRTSVAIDPATGAAESGALFTYEAIPRGTILWFEVIYNNPKLFKVPNKGKRGIELKTIKKDKDKEADIAWLEKNVESGLVLFGFLGVGGMGTRGMGRMKVLNINSREATNATT